MTTAAIARGLDWEQAVESAIREAGAEQPATTPDLALFFASSDYEPHLETMLRRVQSATGAGLVAGCSGQGIIGPEREIEGEPAVSLLTLSLPGASLNAHHLSQNDLASGDGPEYWQRRTGEEPSGINAWILLADPFHLDVEGLLNELTAAYPGTPIVGGLASGASNPHQTYVFLNGEVHAQGAVAIALGGDYTVKTVVSQGCDPIGEPWIITGVSGSIIETISQRPAYEVLVETIRGLSPEMQERASRNLLVGLAIDEYKDAFGRGDFLIRGLTGADPSSGALAIGAYPRLGQTIQFQIRDAAAADEDLRQLLNRAHDELGDVRPAGAILCSCNGRGEGLFGFPDHDARTVAQHLGPVPLAGFFCNGEIGPVGKGIFLHGFTASLGLFVPVGTP